MEQCGGDATPKANSGPDLADCQSKQTLPRLIFHLSCDPNPQGQIMARSEVCGNDYDKSFSVETDGEKHVFDSFECAIQALVPECSHCHCRIIGH